MEKYVYKIFGELWMLLISKNKMFLIPPGENH
jgi:hypothetical protein